MISTRLRQSWVQVGNECAVSDAELGADYHTQLFFLASGI